MRVQECAAILAIVNHKAVFDILSVGQNTLANVPGHAPALAAFTDVLRVCMPRQMIVLQ